MPTPEIQPNLLNDLSYSVTQILSEDTSPNALREMMNHLATSLKWPIAVRWVVDDSKMLLKCADFWKSAEAGNVENFEKVCRARQFSLGEGLPGRTWASKSPEWVDDLGDGQVFSRASVAKMDRVLSGMAFPIYSRPGTLGLSSAANLGVMEFFSKELRPRDETLMRFLFALGGQIGIFLERSRINSELNRLGNSERVRAESNAEAVFTIDEHSIILFANSGVENVFGYKSNEVIGGKLVDLMPERLRKIHEAGLKRFITTGERHIPWSGVRLVGLHKDGYEIPVEIAFGEFLRAGRRVFTGFVRRA